MPSPNWPQSFEPQLNTAPLSHSATVWYIPQATRRNCLSVPESAFKRLPCPPVPVLELLASEASACICTRRGVGSSSRSGPGVPIFLGPRSVAGWPNSPCRALPHLMRRTHRQRKLIQSQTHAPRERECSYRFHLSKHSLKKKKSPCIT